MARLKLLFVAVVVAALGGWYLSQRAESESARIRQQADELLRTASSPVNTVLSQDGQAALASVKAVAQGGSLGETMDADGKPDGQSLETARASLERVQSPEAERPVLIVIAAQGAAARYRVGQSNRLDRDLSAFPPLSAPGSLPRAGVGVFDGDAYRFAVAQFDDPKVPGGKGLLAIGFPLDDAFAQRLMNAAGGTDISLVHQGKIVGSTLPPVERQALQQVAASAKGAVNFGGLTGDRFLITDLVPPLANALRLPMFVVGHRYRGRTLPPAAEAASDLKVIGAVKTVEGYGAIADEQRGLVIGIAIVALLCIVLAIFTRNPARGLGKVVSAAERIVQGDREARAPTVKMGALVRRAAVAVNSLASQVEVAAAAKPDSQAPGLAEELGIRPLRGTGSISSVPVTETAPLEGGAASSGFGGSTQPPQYVSPAPVAVPIPVRRPAPDEPMVLPQKPKPSPAPTAPQPFPAGALEDNPEATVIVPQAAVRPAPAAQSFQRTASQAVPSSPTPAPVALPSPFAGNSEEAHFQQVYRDFVATKEKCGEPADGLTYEKFAAKLRKNQEQLVAKYACRSVRFQVYVKDGKAALKAQPVR